MQGFLIKVAEMNTCNVILVGTEGIREAVRAVDHLQGRGLFPCETIDAYGWRLDANLGGFGDLLDEIDDRLPFRRPSDLSEPETAAHLYRVSSGLIGAVKVYVEAASHLAMNEDADCVTVDHLHEVAQRHRTPGDPYDPFRSAIDRQDPLGERRAADRDALDDAPGGAQTHKTWMEGSEEMTDEVLEFRRRRVATLVTRWLKPKEGEPAHGFLMRLAAAHHEQSAMSFVHRLGLNDIRATTILSRRAQRQPTRHTGETSHL